MKKLPRDCKNLIFTRELVGKSIMNYKSVAEIIAYLNTQGGRWIVLDGTQALTTVTYTSATDIAFNPGNGVVVKIFLNQNTGEMKLFPAKIFGFPDRLIT